MGYRLINSLLSGVLVICSIDWIIFVVAGMSTGIIKSSRDRFVPQLIGLNFAARVLFGWFIESLIISQIVL